MFKRRAGRGRRIAINRSTITFPREGQEAAMGSRRRLRADSLGLSTLLRLGLEEGGQQVEALASLFASFRVFDIDVPAARLPSARLATDQLRSDASNLAAFLVYIATDHPDLFSLLEQDARNVIPGLTKLEFQRIGGWLLSCVPQTRGIPFGAFSCMKTRMPSSPRIRR